MNAPSTFSRLTTFLWLTSTLELLLVISDICPYFPNNMPYNLGIVVQPKRIINWSIYYLKAYGLYSYILSQVNGILKEHKGARIKRLYYYLIIQRLRAFYQSQSIYLVRYQVQKNLWPTPTLLKKNNLILYHDHEQDQRIFYLLDCIL